MLNQPIIVQSLIFMPVPNPFEDIRIQLEHLHQKVDQLREDFSALRVKAPDPEKPMTVIELAEYLDLKPQTVYGLVWRKKIPYKKVQRKLYFLKNEINEWLEQGRK